MGRLTHTVSGGIASFRTPSRVPIESLKFHFLPKQEGSGDPSPTNVRPITGWTGLNGKRTGKNIGHIVNFSANSGQIGETTPQLVGRYGTTLSTITYNLPDTELIITQTNHDEPTDTSYKNGYFAVWIDNLEYNQRYDVSLKVKNVTDPLNVGLNRLRINGPSGGSSQFPTEVNNGMIIYRNVLHAPYIIDGVIKNRKGWEFRLCGMSMTVSEIMVTPANKSDSVFEPYSGETIPITFPVYTKNLFNPRCPTITNQSKFSLNGDKITQTGSDDRGWKDDDRFPPINLPAGTYTLSCSDGNAINFMTSADGYTEATRFGDGVGTFTIGENIGIKFKHSASSYPVTFTIQIESGNQATDYVPFLYGGAWFGGYYDPVAGELVYSWRKFKVKDYEWTYKPGNHRFQTSLSSGEKANASGSWTNFAISDSYKQSNQQGYQNLMIATYSDYYIYIRDDTYEDADDFVEAMGEVEIAYELANPIHIPVTPQDLQAYLDYNNFWSDANDITEVTYEVVESRHILAERIKAMAEESGHHKKVKWNQVVHDGNFTNKNLWYFNSNYGSLSTNNNVITWTCTTQPTQFYHTGFMRDSIRYTDIPWNHKVLVRAMVRCSIATLIRLYAMCGHNGNTHTYFYGENIPANEWTELFGFISDRPETPPAGVDSLPILRFKPCIFGTERDITTVTVGTTLEAKDMVAYDLTEMFGLGNEPQTVAEFERICAINGIDLTTYQPYDTGSDRWLIVP